MILLIYDSVVNKFEGYLCDCDKMKYNECFLCVFLYFIVSSVDCGTLRSVECNKKGNTLHLCE